MQHIEDESESGEPSGVCGGEKGMLWQAREKIIASM